MVGTGGTKYWAGSLQHYISTNIGKPIRYLIVPDVYESSYRA